jgi:hypothetical protein
MTKYPFLYLAICILLVCFTNISKSQTITIKRQFENNECTMGYLFVNDSAICHTLERADYSNNKSTSRIPLGSYKAFIRTDNKIGWRIELIDVPKRENIQIHLGNYPFQTTGCTLIGIDAKPENCTVLNSTLAFNKLRKELLKIGAGLNLDTNSSEKYSITVTFK